MNGQSQPMSQNQANNQTQNHASNNSNSQFPGPGGSSCLINTKCSIVNSKNALR
jgi:hypothetical protein